mmetsp:Transcript_16826/g.48937  ORF Transcript_16826/g.48937 Transcript_16826/m.48937 type:complete len:232 (+) Transcript_16826:958-1653(+)
MVLAARELPERGGLLPLPHVWRGGAQSSEEKQAGDAPLGPRNAEAREARADHRAAHPRPGLQLRRRQPRARKARAPRRPARLGAGVHDGLEFGARRRHLGLRRGLRQHRRHQRAPGQDQRRLLRKSSAGSPGAAGDAEPRKHAASQGELLAVRQLLAAGRLRPWRGLRVLPPLPAGGDEVAEDIQAGHDASRLGDAEGRGSPEPLVLYGRRLARGRADWLGQPGLSCETIG